MTGLGEEPRRASDFWCDGQPMPRPITSVYEQVTETLYAEMAKLMDEATNQIPPAVATGQPLTYASLVDAMQKVLDAPPRYLTPYIELTEEQFRSLPRVKPTDPCGMYGGTLGSYSGVPVRIRPPRSWWRRVWNAVRRL